MNRYRMAAVTIILFLFISSTALASYADGDYDYELIESEESEYPDEIETQRDDQNREHPWWNDELEDKLPPEDREKLRQSRQWIEDHQAEIHEIGRVWDAFLSDHIKTSTYLRCRISLPILPKIFENFSTCPILFTTNAHSTNISTTV